MVLGTQIRFPEYLLKIRQAAASQQVVLLKVKVKVMVKIKFKVKVLVKVEAKFRVFRAHIRFLKIW